MRLELLARVGELRRFEAGSVVFSEGEPGNQMHIVLTGSIRIQGRGREVPVTFAVLGSGSIFGEMSLLEKLPRSTTAVAAEPSTLIAIREIHLQAAIATKPELAIRMLRTLSARVRRLDEALLTGKAPPPVAQAAGEVPVPNSWGGSSGSKARSRKSTMDAGRGSPQQFKREFKAREFLETLLTKGACRDEPSTDILHRASGRTDGCGHHTRIRCFPSGSVAQREGNPASFQGQM